MFDLGRVSRAPPPLPRSTNSGGLGGYKRTCKHIIPADAPVQLVVESYINALIKVLLKISFTGDPFLQFYVFTSRAHFVRIPEVSEQKLGIHA